MAIVWGRALVCLAKELVDLQTQAQDQGGDPTSVALDIEEPKWPEESPFHAIAKQRQPITRRMTFNSATPNDLLILTIDWQFSRGIFHMPHPKSGSNCPSPAGLTPSSSSTNLSNFIACTHADNRAYTRSIRYHQRRMPVHVPSLSSSFSRAKQLYTIAFEVLDVAEKLESTEERQHWAKWADSVLNQMKIEATTSADMDDVWKSSIPRSRGRCRLIIGSAYAEEVETALERGEVAVLRREEAEDARNDLAEAIELFERARAREREKGKEKEKESLAPVDTDREMEEEIATLLTEALVSLANLTEDPKEREALYARARAEAGSDMN